MKTKILRSADRGHANHGWLDTYHSFSFGDYYNPQWMGYRSLRVLNDDLVMPGMGFPMHPHKDMEIISYVLSGALAHEDSMGNRRVVNAGEFQFMSAGSGVRHSEYNPSTSEATRLLQIWIKPTQKGATPRYAEKSMAEAPAGSSYLIASPTGRDESIALRQNADLWLAKLHADQSIEHKLPAGQHAWVHVAEGDISLNSESLRAGDAAAIEADGVLKLTANKPSQVLIFNLD